MENEQRAVVQSFARQSLYHDIKLPGWYSPYVSHLKPVLHDNLSSSSQSWQDHLGQLIYLVISTGTGAYMYIVAVE